jgi:hypothetical protein
LCLDQHDISDLDRLTESGGPFDFSNVHEFSLRIVNAAADSLSASHQTKSDLEQGGKWTRKQIQTYCGDYDSKTTTCVPVFRREQHRERIDLYFVTWGEDGNPTKVTLEGGFRLL